MRVNHAELLCGGVCVALAGFLAAYIMASPWHTPGAEIMDHNSFFPLTACAMLGALGAWQCVWAVRQPVSEATVSLNWRGLFLLVVWLGFAFLVPFLGFLAGGILFLCLSMYIWGERRLHLIAAVGGGLPFLIYVILGKLMHVSYPKGIIPF